jgi:hypothetical protein
VLCPFLAASILFIAPTASSQDSKSDTLHHGPSRAFVSEKYGYRFTAPPDCIAKVADPDNYFRLHGWDNPQFIGHVEVMNPFFRDTGFPKKRGHSKASFHSAAISASIGMFEGEVENGRATASVDSVHRFRSPHGLDVMFVFVTQTIHSDANESETEHSPTSSRGFVVWVDISHAGRSLALILNPWEAKWHWEKAKQRAMDIVNSLRLISAKEGEEKE